MNTANARNLINSALPADLVENADDWTMCGSVAAVHHRPSATVFRVLVDLDKALDETLALEDFRALLVRYRGGLNFPSPQDLERLRAEAVLMSLSYAGMVAFEPATNGQCAAL
jgi:hypothetical protein